MSPAAPDLTFAARGEGPDVVLVHGALGDYRQWDPIAERLSRHFRTLALSRRFHWPGRPPAADAPYTFESHRDDLIAFLESLSGPAHLVGHSWGAGVALIASLARPDLVRSLVLIELPLGGLVPSAVPGAAAERASRHEMSTAVAEHLKAGEVERAGEILIEWVQGTTDGFHRLPDAVREGLRANAATVGPTLAATQPHVTRGQLSALPMPVLVLYGARTRPWYRLVSETAAACIPGAEMACVPDASHMLIVEHPFETGEAIAAFLARH